MVKYVTKTELASQIRKILLEDSSLDKRRSFIPFLASDNQTATYECETCSHKKKVKFKFNIATAAGTDRVIFDWNLDLERLYLTGYVCRNCENSEIKLHENSVENDPEIIFEQEEF